MFLTFGRDELTAQFGAWKFFLFDEQDVEIVTREMNRRTRPRRPRTGDDHVEIFAVVHCVSRAGGT